jgi:hypothetical protein
MMDIAEFAVVAVGFCLGLTVRLFDWHLTSVLLRSEAQVMSVHLVDFLQIAS